MAPTTIGLRPRAASDDAFLRALYTCIRMPELAQVDWTHEAKQAFLSTQFDAQTKHYDEPYHAADFAIVERDGEAIGRLYVYDQAPDDVRIVDIALVPEACGQGIGGKLLSDVIAAANAAGKSVSIHVEQFNPALRLYRRLGFEQVGEFGVYYLMRRPPG